MFGHSCHRLMNPLSCADKIRVLNLSELIAAIIINFNVSRRSIG